MKLRILVAVVALGVAVVSDSFGQRLAGVVVDAENGRGLAGANVRLVKLGVSVAADSEGKFGFGVAVGAHQLQVSSVGYETLILNVVSPDQELVVKLALKSTELREVVVNTGYQKLDRERATGSFSVVDAKTFNEQVGPDILSRLENVLPALSVDRRTNGRSIMVRGLSSLQGERAPLIVVDDFPYAGDLSNLNPNDVENITVLKDAAASSIWGARGGNGVIVITTKKGAYDKKLTVDFTTNGSVKSLPALDNFRNVSAAELIAVERNLFGRGFYTSQENNAQRLPLSPAVELLIANRSGQLGNADLEARLAGLALQDIRQNYRNDFLERAWSQQYTLNLKGGTTNHHFYVLGGYDSQVDELGAFGDRISLKMDQSFRWFGKLEFGLSALLTQSTTVSGRQSLAGMTTSNGMLPVYTMFSDSGGNALPVMKNYRNSYLETLGGGSLLDWKYYPLTEGGLTQSRNSLLDILANFRLGYTVVKGLKLSANYQYERGSGSLYQLNTVDSYFTRNLVNQFSVLSGSNVIRNIPLGGISNDSGSLLVSHQVRGQVNYDVVIGDFGIQVLGGMELRDNGTRVRSNQNFGVDEELFTSAPVDYVTPFRNLVTGATSYIPFGNSDVLNVSRYVSNYFSGSLDYLKKYTLSGSVRRDASNVFGVATNNRWNPLWSVGLSWNVSQESWFWKRLLPYARLRLTYGQSGNSDSRNAAVTTIAYLDNSLYTRLPRANFGNYANPDLKWETVKTFNVGGDFKWLNGRLALSAEYYLKRSVDLIARDAIDPTAGVGTAISRNAAEISARGFDLELSGLLLDGGLKWQMSAFGNFYKDRIDKYYLGSQLASNFVNGNLTVSGVEGQAVYTVYGYRWAGLNPMNGNPMGYLNGTVSENWAAMTGAGSSLGDLDNVGRAFPTLTGAWGNNFNWNGFSLDVRMAFKVGHYFRRQALSYSNLYSIRSGDNEYVDRWRVSGDEAWTNVPSEVYPASTARDAFYTRSTATVTKGDHLRMQYVGLGYTFEKAKFSGLPFRRVSVKAVANNLGVLWKATDFDVDPDFPDGKPQKLYSFNLQIGF